MYILEEAARGWCCGSCSETQYDIGPVMSLVKTALSIIRIIVPIILIAMTTLDIAKKVINPEEKEAQKKIMFRAIAALIIFLIPNIVGFVFSAIDWGQGEGADPMTLDTTLKECWENPKGNNN